MSRACTVALSNGGSASSKALACSLSSLDADGAVTSSVPVDPKLK